MEIRLSSHAEQQIAARKLTRDTVIEVALAPEQVVVREGELPIGQSPITWLDKPGLLRVVFRDEGEVRLVVTAYPTTQVRKYWQVANEDTL